MANQHQDLADQVVHAFQAKLDPATREAISKAQFEDLGLMVREALAQAVGTAVERMEQVIRELRATSGKPEIEL